MVAPGGAIVRIDKARCDDGRRVIADTPPSASG
jgi:hypothetical protein